MRHALQEATGELGAGLLAFPNALLYAFYLMTFRLRDAMEDKTRAVEPVIAALLLIAIAVAAAVITYSWVMGMIGGQQSQAGTAIRFDNVAFKVSSSGFINVTVRNTGSVSANIATIYINGVVLNSNVTKSDGTDLTLPQTIPTSGSTNPTTFYVKYRVAKSTTYAIKVVIDNGFTLDASYTSGT